MIDDVDSLDKENLGWTKAYVDGLAGRLERERAHEPPDAEMIAYLERELETYRGLLDRVAGAKA